MDLLLFGGESLGLSFDLMKLSLSRLCWWTRRSGRLLGRCSLQGGRGRRMSWTSSRWAMIIMRTMRTGCPDHLQKQNTVVDFINQPILRTICWIKRWSRLSADTNLTYGWSWAWYQSKRKPVDDQWKWTFNELWQTKVTVGFVALKYLLVSLFTTQMYFHGFTNYPKIKFSKLREKD